MLRSYLAAQDYLSEIVGQVVSWLSLVMIGILIYEIFQRYFLNAPTIWAHELSTMLYGAFCMLAGSYTLRHKGHVRSEVIYGLLSARGQAICDLIAYGAGMVVLGVFLKFAIIFAVNSWEISEFSNKSIWQPALYPLKTVIPVAIIFVMLQNLAELVRAVCRVFRIPFEDPRDDGPEVSSRDAALEKTEF